MTEFFRLSRAQLDNGESVKVDDYVLTADDNGKYFVANKATAIDFTLPDVALAEDNWLATFKNAGAGSLTLTGEIDGSTDLILTTGQSAAITGNGVVFRSLFKSSGGGSVPDGGTTGQVLAKNSNADGDATWQDVTGGGPGPSAYDVAVSNGFVGTELEWLDSLHVDGDDGAPGQGVPTGGTVGQMLAKNSSTNYDTEWVDAPSGAGEANTLASAGGTVSLAGTKVGTVLKVKGLDAGQGVSLASTSTKVTIRTVFISATDPGAVGPGTIWVVI